MMRRLLQRIRARTSGRFVRDTRGAAAVELAIITPAILGLFFGTAELADGVAVDRKVTITARSLSDLVAQYDDDRRRRHDEHFQRDDGDHDALFGYAAEDQGVGRQHRRRAATQTSPGAMRPNDTARKPNDAVTIPTALKIPNTQLIWSEISYAYTPTVAKYIIGSLPLDGAVLRAPAPVQHDLPSADRHDLFIAALHGGLSNRAAYAARIRPRKSLT